MDLPRVYTTGFWSSYVAQSASILYYEMRVCVGRYTRNDLTSITFVCISNGLDRSGARNRFLSIFKCSIQLPASIYSSRKVEAFNCSFYDGVQPPASFSPLSINGHSSVQSIVAHVSCSTQYIYSFNTILFLQCKTCIICALPADKYATFPATCKRRPSRATYAFLAH